MPKPGPACPYCPDNPTSKLVDAAEVYGPSKAGQFSVWVCANYPDCGTYVGVKRGSQSAEPTGTLANSEFRALRKRLKAIIADQPAGNRADKIARQKKISKVNWMSEEQCRDALMALHQPMFRENQ